MIRYVNQGTARKPIAPLLLILFVCSVFFITLINLTFVDAIKGNPNGKSKLLSNVEFAKSNTSKELGSPFMILYLKLMKHKVESIEGVPTVLLSIAGNGTADHVDYILNRTIFLSVPKGGQYADINGYGKMIANGDKGSSDFKLRERIYNDTISNESSVGAIFFTNSKGTLQFLGNSSAVFQVIDYKNDTTVLKAWKWS